VVVLSLVFGRSWYNDSAAIFFVSMLLPVVLGTSYFFNYILVPYYFIKKKYFRFILYSFYLLVISLYLETLVLTFSFVYFANLSLENMAPNSHAILLLAVVMYLLVFLGSFLLMAQQVKENNEVIKKLITEQKKYDIPTIKVRSNRQALEIALNNITYIESMADYIIIHTTDNQIKTKEKISSISTRLPNTFIRIHRSFIVNKAKVTTTSTTQLQIDNQTLPISRTYQKTVKQHYSHS
jgi:ribosomal silencing factor RsfS